MLVLKIGSHTINITSKYISQDNSNHSEKKKFGFLIYNKVTMAIDLIFLIENILPETSYTQILKISLLLLTHSSYIQFYIVKLVGKESTL